MVTRKPLLAVALAATLIGSALAQSRSTPTETPPDRPMSGMEGRGGMGSRGMNPERMFEGLDLSDAQRTQLRAMADDHRRAVEPLRDRMRAAQQVLDTAQPGDPDYDTKTADARKTLQESRGRMRDEMETFRARTDAVLTPEQRKQVEQRRSEMRERMEERRGERGGMEGRGGRRGDGDGGHPRRGG